MSLKSVAVASIALLTLVAASLTTSAGKGPKGHGHDNKYQTLEQMRETHRSHMHEHDFKAMEAMAPEQMRRMMRLMKDIGLAMPPMNSQNGRKLFVEKGCVVCHVVNGVGSEVGPSLNAADMPKPMNAFDFAARMWRGAPAMIALQEDQLGGVIELTGQELADLVAFAHDEAEQKKLEREQIPKRFRETMAQ